MFYNLLLGTTRLLLTLVPESPESPHGASLLSPDLLRHMYCSQVQGGKKKAKSLCSVKEEYNSDKQQYTGYTRDLSAALCNLCFY